MEWIGEYVVHVACVPTALLLIAYASWALSELAAERRCGDSDCLFGGGPESETLRSVEARLRVLVAVTVLLVAAASTVYAPLGMGAPPQRM